MNKITTALKSLLRNTVGNLLLVPALVLTVIMEWADSLTIINKKESGVE